MLLEVFDEKIVCIYICINIFYFIFFNLKVCDKILKFLLGNIIRVYVFIF